MDLSEDTAGINQSPNIRGDGSTAALQKPSRVLRVEVNGSLHDWFDIEEMGDFVRSPTFADTLLENIARYFGVPVENQAIYDEDGLLTTSADFSRALQRVAPMLYIYDVNEMGPELKERTVEELAMINAGVEQSWRNFRMLSTRGPGPLANLGTLAPAAASSAAGELGIVAESSAANVAANEAYMSPTMSQQAYMSPMMNTQAYMSPNLSAQAGNSKQVVDSAGVDGVCSGAPAPVTSNATEDALLSAKSQALPGAAPAAQVAPYDVQVGSAQRQASMNGGSQTGASKFGGGTLPGSEAETTDGQGDQPAVQIYSLLAPAATPDGAGKPNLSTPALRLSSGVEASTSAQTTARTVLSSTGVREDALTARSSGLRPGKILSPQLLAPQVSASSLRQPQRGLWSPAPQLPARSTTLPLPVSTAASASAGTAPAALLQPAGWWPAFGAGLSSAASAAVPNGSTSVMQWQLGAGEEVGLARMLSSNAFVGPYERAHSPTRSVTPTPKVTRSVTPTKTATALGYESRVLTHRPPPVSPAPIGPRSSLVRMPSGSHLPYTPVCATERSHSPTRAVTPTPITARSHSPTRAVTSTPITARSVTPVSQHRAPDFLSQATVTTAPVRSATPPPAMVQQYSGRSTTPIRSQTAAGRPSVGGYAATPLQT